MFSSPIFVPAPPHVFNWIQVRGLARPLQKTDLMLLEGVLRDSGVVLTSVRLQDPSGRHVLVGPWNDIVDCHVPVALNGHYFVNLDDRAYFIVREGAVHCNQSSTVLNSWLDELVLNLWPDEPRTYRMPSQHPTPVG